MSTTIPWAARRGTLIQVAGQAPILAADKRDLDWYAAALCLAISAAFPVQANVSYVPFPNDPGTLAIRIVVTESFDGSRSWATLVYLPLALVADRNPFDAARSLPKLIHRLVGPGTTWVPGPGTYGRPPFLFGQGRIGR
jgi:hypothetical protein